LSPELSIKEIVFYGGPIISHLLLNPLQWFSKKRPWNPMAWK